MKILLSILFTIFLLGVNAQVFVQLELFNDPNTKKYSIGDQITYKMNYSKDYWQKGTIEQILIKENTLVLHNDIVKINEISHFMLYRKSILYFGGTAQSFGLIWLVQGSIAALLNKNTSWSRVLGIGGGSLLGGWILRKLFYKIPISLGEKNRLRIVDLRFFVPDSEENL